jgi:hypothetical protein
MNSPLQYVVPNYSNVSVNATIFNGTVTRVTHQLSARYASLKSIFCTMRTKADGELTFFPLNSTHFDLKYWNFRIGSQLVPSKQISSLQESYCELLKAIGSVADLNHEPSINFNTYAKEAVPLGCTEVGTTLHATTKSNCFAIGLDLETYATADRDNLWAGMNTLTSDVFLNADFGGNLGGANQNVRFDFYSLFDQVLVFENGSIRVVNTIYINGEAVVSKVQPPTIPGRRPQDILLLGAAPVLSDYTLWGTIHEFRIWSGVFTENTARVSYEVGPDHVNNRK